MIDKEKTSLSSDSTKQNNTVDDSSCGRELLEVEIDLLDYWRVFIEQKRIIFGCVFIGVMAATIVALSSSPRYRAEALVAPVEASANNSGIGAIASQFGGLGALAGVSVPVGGRLETSMATLQSRAFLTKFVAAENLKPILFRGLWDSSKQQWLIRQSLNGKVKSLFGLDKPVGPLSSDLSPGEPSDWKVYKLLTSSVLSISHNRKSGLVTIAVVWDDPVLAANWANLLVKYINEELRLRAISEAEKSIAYLNEQIDETSVSELRGVLFKIVEEQMKSITLARASDEYSFKVIDPAFPPERPFSPKKKLIMASGFVISVIFAVFIVFMRHAIHKRKLAK